MGVTISELPGITSIAPNDKFEIEKQEDNTSYNITIKQIMDYFKKTSNGGFRGSAAGKSLDDFTIADVGVWVWEGTTEFGPDNIKSGIVELISVDSPDDYNNTAITADRAILLQRISLGRYSYQRMYMYNTQWTPWGAMSNENGCKILYGQTDVASNEQIWFNDTHTAEFLTNPIVTVSPISHTDEWVYFVNVDVVTTSYFTVRKFMAPLHERKVVTSNTTNKTVNKDTSGNETTVETATEEITQTAGSIQTDDDSKSSFSFNWQAMSDVTKAGDL